MKKKKVNRNDVFLNIPRIEVIDKFTHFKKEILKQPTYSSLAELDRKYSLGIFEDKKNGRRKPSP